MASDEEIQGSKDAVIQDLERKLRFKEDLLNNGQPVGGGRGRGHAEQGQAVGAVPGASEFRPHQPQGWSLTLTPGLQLSTVLTAGVAPPPSPHAPLQVDVCLWRGEHGGRLCGLLP